MTVSVRIGRALAIRYRSCLSNSVGVVAAKRRKIGCPAGVALQRAYGRLARLIVLFDFCGHSARYFQRNLPVVSLDGFRQRGGEIGGVRMPALFVGQPGVFGKAALEFVGEEMHGLVEVVGTLRGD